MCKEVAFGWDLREQQHQHFNKHLDGSNTLSLMGTIGTQAQTESHAMVCQEMASDPGWLEYNDVTIF